MENLSGVHSPRTIRIIYSTASVLVLLLTLFHALNVLFFKATSNDQCGWLVREKPLPGGVITQIVPGGVADRAGLKEGDILLAINDRKFTYTESAMQIINSIKRNDYAEYTIDRAGTIFKTQVQILKVFDVRYLVNFLLGFGFLVVGHIVVMSRPQGFVQRMFGRYGIFAMLLLGMSQLNISAANLYGIAPWLYYVYAAALVLGWVFSIPTMVLFFLHFPVKTKAASWLWLKVSLYFFSLVTVIPTVLRLFFATQLMLPGFIMVIVNITPGVFFFGGLIVFAVNYFRGVDRSRRKQLRPIFYSVIIGALTAAYSNVLQGSNQFVIFTQPILLLPTFLLLLLPLSFGYSIFKYRLMDIDFVIKRSLLYAMVTAMLAGLYLLLVYLIGQGMSYALGIEDNQLGSLLAFVILAFAFDPLKRRAQDWIDRVFYQERYNYQKALLEFSQELPTKIHLDQILGSMISRISATMHVEKVAVVLCDETEGCSSSTQHIDSINCAFGRESNGLLALLRATRNAQSFALLETEPDLFNIHESDKQKILRAGVVLSVPMFMQGRLIGTILVGPKMSGKVYSQEDIDLLSTVGGQAAIAIENARLHESEIEKKRIEEELSLARRIQQGLLPKENPPMTGLDIAGVSIPALTVGGDYFDYIPLGANKLLVVVGDVSGKGMSAALYMSKIQGMIQIIAPMYLDPKEILIQVNRQIYESLERRSFITMILALFDMEKKEVRICRAGHNKALIGVNGTLEYLKGGGIGLGLERGPVFEQELEEIKQPFNKNSIFVFYSDGLTEAMNEGMSQFGEEAVFAIVKEKRGLGARELQTTILKSVEDFRGAAEQNDDLTVVVVKASL
jgi:serine phosphatase RsbU (regulator of sigma subunit)